MLQMSGSFHNKLDTCHILVRQCFTGIAVQEAAATYSHGLHGVSLLPDEIDECVDQPMLSPSATSLLQCLTYFILDLMVYETSGNQKSQAAWHNVRLCCQSTDSLVPSLQAGLRGWRGSMATA